MKDEIVKSLLEMPHQDGDRLPSIRILMQTMRAASGTVQNAIALLKAQGLVYSDPGRGTFWGQRQRVKIEVPNPDGRQTLWEKFLLYLRYKSLFVFLRGYFFKRLIHYPAKILKLFEKIRE